MARASGERLNFLDIVIILLDIVFLCQEAKFLISYGVLQLFTQSYLFD